MTETKLTIVDSTALESAVESNPLIITGDMTITTVLDAVKNIPAIKPGDMKFLVDHKEHLAMITEKTFQWRTDSQKRSIINDFQHPTVHGKFHQAILEQKVQFEQGMYLAKEYESKQLDIEEKEIEIQDILDAVVTRGDELPTRKEEIKIKRMNLELNFMRYELENMYISMGYRMAEVRGWQTIIDDCLVAMHQEGRSEEYIWTRDAGETEQLFLAYMRKVLDIPRTNDPAAANNILSLAAFAYQDAKKIGVLEDCLLRLDQSQKQGLSFVKQQMIAAGMEV